MSPSESELRASLREGAGERPDVDRIVEAAGTARRQRRTALAAVAGAVVVVVGVGAIVAAIAGGGRDSEPVASPPHTMYPGPVPAPTCPEQLPRLPEAGGPVTAGRLFSTVAESVLVCGYGAERSRDYPASVVFTGREATELQRSMEEASRTPRRLSCAATRSTAANYLAVYARVSNGPSMPVVTTVLTLPICDSVLTNGAARRYGWTPPPDLRERLFSLLPQNFSTLPTAPVTPGRVTKTPVR